MHSKDAYFNSANYEVEKQNVSCGAANYVS